MKTEPEPRIKRRFPWLEVVLLTLLGVALLGMWYVTWSGIPR